MAKPKPVTQVEIEVAVMRMLVDRFDGRPIDWQTIERALVQVNFEIKQAAIFAPRKETA
jgi:hypothetical protein